MSGLMLRWEPLFCYSLDYKMVINRKSSECHKRTYIGNSSFVCAPPWPLPFLSLVPYAACAACSGPFSSPSSFFPPRPLLPLSCLPFLSLYAALGACCPLRRPAPALLRSLRLPFFCVKISVFSTFCPPVRCVSCLCFSSCGVKKVSKRFGDTEKSSTFAIPFEKWASLSGR